MIRHTPQVESAAYFRRLKSVASAFWFALLGLLEILIFFRNPQHFFERDSLTWLSLRYRSFGEFITGFFHLDPAFWYRPLAQRTVESLLFPIVGLNPVPYRILGFVLFFCCTKAVHSFIASITQSKRIAWLGTLFFAIHVVNAYVTYDVAFTPELLFTLFYVCSAIAYLRYLRDRNSLALIASLLLFIGSLLSKETAATLPFTLVAIWQLAPGARRGLRYSPALHFGILAAYLIFVVGYLHVREIHVGSVVQGTGSVGNGIYQLVFGKNVLDNADVALSWAFNISRYMGQWRFSAQSMGSYLRVIRILIAAGALVVLFRQRRNLLLLGFIWFFVACAPTLLLVRHFVPYYIFASLVGFSLAVGVILDFIYQQTATIAPAAAFSAFAIFFAILSLITSSGSHSVASGVGRSAEEALTRLNDVHRVCPTLPKSATLVLFDEEQPLDSWDRAQSNLFRMAYADDSISTRYSSNGEWIDSAGFDAGTSFAFKLHRDRLIDVTTFVKQRRDLLMAHDSGIVYNLELSTPEVHSGAESFVLRVPELPNTAASILYARNGTVIEPLTVHFDASSEVELNGSDLPPGTYTFIAVKASGQSSWVVVDATLYVR